MIARLCAVLVAAFLFGVVTPAAAQKDGKGDKKNAQKDAENYDKVFDQYLATSKTLSQAPPPTPWMSTLFGDVKARNVNDLVTVQVIENVVASGSADSSLDKSSAARAGSGKLFGFDISTDKFDPSELAKWAANTTFKGSGATTRSGALEAVVTARVSEVMPNGDLVLEGVRELDINGDRQIVVLSGIVRPTDIGPGNVVPSTAVGQMRIRYFGRGLIKDNLTPGWLVRVFNKIF